MKVLITGGAGFIGANYVYTHLEAKPQDEIFVIDALTYSGDRSRLKEAEENGVQFIEGRIEDKDLVFSLFEKYKFDIVVNFAAETHVDRSIKDATPFVLSNVQGTQVLLDACKKYGITRYHQISTDEVYGDTPFDSEILFSEEDQLSPNNPYSATKAASDLLCLSYYKTFGIPVTIIRCSNNYGPFQSTENFIPLFITKANNDEKMPLYGRGENVRDWLYVRDHGDAILAILDRGSVGEIYNIGGNNEWQNIDVTKLILKDLNKDFDLIEFVEDRPGHDRRYGVNSSKIQKELGWKPKTSFEEGMQETINWYTLNSYERNYSCWRDGLTPSTSNKSHQQTSSSDL